MGIEALKRLETDSRGRDLARSGSAAGRSFETSRLCKVDRLAEISTETKKRKTLSSRELLARPIVER